MGNLAGNALTSLREREFVKEIVGDKIGKLFGCHYHFGYISLILFIDITLKMLRKIQYHKHKENNIDNTH